MSNFCSNTDVTKVFVIEGQQTTFTANTTVTIDGDLYVNGNIYNCSTGGSETTIYTDNIDECSISGVTINNNITVFHTEILPTSDTLINFGSPTRRFRNINTVSGTSTVWTATGIIYTPILNLGQDLSGDTREITAENSIIQDDILLGGDY